MTTMAERRAIPAETLEAQARASDPAASAWVSANAGSGKTHVLAQRVIRLLLAGVEPARILCLTFTRAAASEMSNRIFERLGGWARMDDGALAGELRALAAAPPDGAAIARARTLFALALDTPGGLKIQTIHAFCEALLHQFPLEANVPGHFEVVDEPGQRELLEEARRLTLAIIDAPGQERLREAFGFLVDNASDVAIDKALGEIVVERERFDDWTGGDIDAAMAPLWRQFGMAPETTRDGLIAQMLEGMPVSDAELERLAALARVEGGTTNRDFAEAVAGYLAAGDVLARLRLRNRMLLTAGKKTARVTIVTKAVLAGAPDLADKLAAAAAQAEADQRMLANWRMLKGSACLFRFADAMLDRYETLKRSRALVDFADLISRAGNLLNRTDVRDWVRYKLDRGIDHVLIDEAQDTSPRQWEIIDAIVAEFHAGEGAQRAERTVFAVGDEKQSIFSFQGADPAGFARQAATIGRRAGAAGKPFRPVRLNLSFRSSPDILGAVDRVFALPENARGLGEDSKGTVHAAIRTSDPGEVRLWPILARQAPAERTDWLAPVDAPEPDDPAIALARRMAATIRRWIDTGEKLPGRDRPIRHGDILILVRKRDRFMTAVIRELKQRGLRIAGADRLKLTEHIAVEDLMALGRAIAMPLDDLSLAAVLKSPLFDVDEESLLALCAERGGRPLWDHLRRLADAGGDLSGRAGALLARLEELRADAASATVHGFYAHVLGRAGGRRAFLARLGSEAEDVLDAFEEATLDHEQRGGAGLEDFLAKFGRAEPEIKRDIDVRRDEIRVITVHAAKGLEAPIVFLVDPCSPGYIAQFAPSVIRRGGNGGPDGYLWVQGARDASPAIGGRMAEIRASAEEEYRRLLYVAMTRAADRLVVCGYRGLNEPKEDHWHVMVERALRPDARPVVDAAGNPDGFVWRHPDPAVRAAARERPATAPAAPPLAPAPAVPPWLWRDATAEPPLPRPLNPSAALVLKGRPVTEEPGETGAPVAAIAVDGRQRRLAMERGTAVHRLLQFLPGVAAAERPATGRDWLSRNQPDWDAAMIVETLGEALAVIADPRHAALFGPGSRAEAGIAGFVNIGGRRVLVSGQIDRLAVGPQAIVLADFKTNRVVPDDPGAVEEAYRLQLALYRALIAAVHPARPIRCQLIWTRTNSVTELAQAELDAALAAITPP